MKGLAVWVYKSKIMGDCTNGGISSKHDEVLLVGPNIPQISQAHGRPCVTLRELGGAINAVPCDEDGKVDPKPWWMMGGNFIHCCDSRFPSRYPIPLHDRQEQDQDQGDLD